LQQELEAYSDMQGTLNAKLGETKDCEASIARLKAEIKALDGQKREIEFSIKDLATSGVDQIKRVGQEARGELESLKVEIKKWGEIKAEAGKLEQELKFARYLTAIDAEVIRKLPGEIAILLVDRIRLWCEFRAVNPKVKAGEGVHEVCYSIPSYAEIGPIHLLEWARRGLLQGMEAK
jgi:seryl-tRNA synthetase